MQDLAFVVAAVVMLCVVGFVWHVCSAWFGKSQSEHFADRGQKLVDTKVANTKIKLQLILDLVVTKYFTGTTYAQFRPQNYDVSIENATKYSINGFKIEFPASLGIVGVEDAGDLTTSDQQFKKNLDIAEYLCQLTVPAAVEIQPESPVPLQIQLSRYLAWILTEFKATPLEPTTF